MGLISQAPGRASRRSMSEQNERAADAAASSPRCDVGIVLAESAHLPGACRSRFCPSRMVLPLAIG